MKKDEEGNPEIAGEVALDIRGTEGSCTYRSTYWAKHTMNWWLSLSTMMCHLCGSIGIVVICAR